MKEGSELELEAEKWAKIIAKTDKDLVEALGNMPDDELKKRTLQAQRNLLENERQRKDDDALRGAKKRFDEKKAPYDDAKKFQTAILNLGSLLLEDKGVSLYDEEG